MNPLVSFDIFELIEDATTGAIHIPNYNLDVNLKILTVFFTVIVILYHAHRAKKKFWILNKPPQKFYYNNAIKYIIIHPHYDCSILGFDISSQFVSLPLLLIAEIVPLDQNW